jgi:hypothetical protein
MPQKSGAACVISHHSSFNYEGPAFLMRSRAFLLLAGCSNWFVLFIWFIWSVWFNQTNEINQITVFFCWRSFSASC